MSDLYCTLSCCADEDYLPPSDEALAKLRTLLASEDVFAPYPASLTVYTAAGTFTVEGVREDSIVVNDAGVLTCESDDTRNARVYVFYRVGGYSTVLG